MDKYIEFDIESNITSSRYYRKRQERQIHMNVCERWLDKKIA